MSDTPDEGSEEQPPFMAIPLQAMLGGLGTFRSQEQMDRHHMALEEKHTRIKRFYDEQTIENLATFGQLMSDLAHLHDGSDYAAYLQGRAEAILEHVHGVCGHCGVNHDSLDEIVNDDTEVEE